MAETIRIRDIGLVGGHPALDFVNSLDWRTSDHPTEYLNSFDDFLEWSVLIGQLTSAEAQLLRRIGSASSPESALRQALTFRESAYRVLIDAMAKRAPSPKDVKLISDTIKEAHLHRTLTFDKTGFFWRFEAQNDLRLPLFKIALSLEELLISSHLGLIHECGGPGCGWLFLDQTKNHSRRWCSMDGCGNRAKVKRFYERNYR